MFLAVFRFEVADTSSSLYWLPSDGVLFTGGGMPGVFSAFEWVDLPPLFLLPLVAEFLCFTRLPAENLSFVFQEKAL